jgi:hypothetical protein
MKTSILAQNEIGTDVVELVQRLVAMIPWPARRQAMGDVAKSLLNGKPRVAEDVFGWGRSVVELGMSELQTGIACVNDLSKRRKPMLKEKLVPGGILETDSGKAFLFFTPSNKTSDFMADGIDLWWDANRERLSTARRIVVNMDNGPECSGHRNWMPNGRRNLKAVSSALNNFLGGIFQSAPSACRTWARDVDGAV